MSSSFIHRFTVRVIEQELLLITSCKMKLYSLPMQTVTTATNNSKHDYWKSSSFNLEAIAPIYSIILFACISGNTLVCLTIAKNRHMRSRWHSLLVNLSVADMGLALAIPFQTLQFVNVSIGKFL